jgi:hypothetical protein
LRAEADTYRTVFQKVLRERWQSSPTWQDDAELQHHLVPTAVAGETPDEIRHAFYLDTGPLFLVFAGLLDADDPMSVETLAWFRSGPPTKLYRLDGNCFQTPSLRHEISSCEPCYSWNVFHAWQLGDRRHFLEGMYSLLAGAVSRKTFTVCETRGGVTGLTPALTSVYLARLAVIDEQIVPGELHLLRLMPRAWITSHRAARFLGIPTEFGPLDLEVRLNEGTDELRVQFRPHYRLEPKRVVLHVPPVAGLKTIRINDKREVVADDRIVVSEK